MELPNPFRLHIGGEEAKEGWRILNVQPGAAVDYVGDMRDLSDFPDACCDELYASHVLEHVSYQGEVHAVLTGFLRILKPGGLLRVSVPDLQMMAMFLSNPDLELDKRLHVMRIVFGGQINDFDYHKVGFDAGILDKFLREAGFSDVERVDAFGLFDDASNLRLGDYAVSLNVQARRPASAPKGNPAHV